MSLLDDLSNPPRKATGFAEWLTGQDVKIREALEESRINPEWSDYALEKLLRRHGAPVSRDAIVKWRSVAT